MNKSELKEEILRLVEQYGELVEEQVPFVGGNSAVPPSGKVVGRNELKMMADAYHHTPGSLKFPNFINCAGKLPSL